MPVDIIVTPSRLTALLSGEIDHHNAPALREAVDRIMREKRPPILRLDFGEVSFMDSSGVGLVMGRYAVAKDVGAVTEVVNLSERHYRVMRMSGIEKIAKVSKREAHI